MRIARSISALIGCAALLAGCGGGGGGSTPTTHTTTATSSATSAPTGAPLATAKLTIKFPATFHTAKKASATARTSATSTRRTPAYVNPNGNDYLDVYVNGVDESSQNISTTLSDGSQSISLPLYSGNTQQIVAVETINGVGNNPVQVLAIGETDLPTNSFQPGDATNIGLTMLMNAVGAGITSDYSGGSDATIDTMLQTPYEDVVCNIPGTGSILYLFAYDAQSGYETGQQTFVAAGGLGIVVPTLGGFTNQTGTYPLDSVVTSFPQTGLAAGFEISYQSSTGGLVLNALTSNPAAVVQQDAFANGQVYPGIDALFQNGTLYNVIYAIGNPNITTQIYVDPYPQGCD
jgi:hypothetical protein